MSEGLVISCRGLVKSYVEGGLHVDVLKGIDLDVRPGDCLAVIGASGSGKSTLLHLLGGLDNVSGGEVMVSGRRMSSLSERERGELRNHSLGFVYQFHYLLPEFTALENVCMPLLIRGSPVNEAGSLAEEVLSRVGLGQRLQHKPGELSGGERQRAAIARALVTRPQCILADEPTGNLDEKTAEQVFDVMLELNRQYGASLVMVSHNMGLVHRFDRVLNLHEGRIQELPRERGVMGEE
jgi:lipoprotein-releasing system ATP-binding protein